MADSSDILWNLYQEHCEWERHHEEQRASVTNILVVVAAGVLSVITLNNGLTRSDLPLTIFLIMQGLFGALFVAKQYERFARHQRLAGTYREALNDHFPESQIIALRDKADQEQANTFRTLYRPAATPAVDRLTSAHCTLRFGIDLGGFVFAYLS